MRSMQENQDQPAQTPGASTRAAWMTAAIVVVVSLLSTFTLSKPSSSNDPAAGAPARVQAGEDLGEDVPAEQTGDVAAGSEAPGVAAPTGAASKSYDCSKRQNAGATDVGVSRTEIRFAATVVKSGIAKDFLSDAQYGMEAVRQKVNRTGGICGRLIKIDYKDDGWDPRRGGDIIESYIGTKRYFGLAVNPSSEGLKGAIDSGTIKRAQFPVIGADGMLRNQYEDPWVWPVAASTSSVMHVMAANAFARGARNFGIVWESNYRFGVEGHDAFIGTISRLGGNINADVGIKGGQNSYKTNVDDFIGRCGGVNSLEKCQFIAVLLEPNTASQWVRDGGLGNGNVRPKFPDGTIGIGGPQPLFIDSFARDCGKFCANMWVWTSFKPPIPPFDTDPSVTTYRSDLANVSATADPNNPHVEGAYVGMLLLVEALRKAGPTVTRLGIKSILDSMTIDTGLAPPLSFRAGNHFSNTSAQAFESIVNNASFANWRYTNSGFIADKEVGRDLSR